jgi:putative MATE family efflux protein
MLLVSGIVIIDGLFIGNNIGKAGLAGVTLTLPVLYLFLGITIMIGVGGSVMAGHALGAKNHQQANRSFSLTVVLAAVVITGLTVFFFLSIETLLEVINPNQDLKRLVRIYLSTILWFYPAMMMNIIFAIFLRAQGNPGLSLLFGVAGNFLNIVLDYFMIARWGMGLRGAALATGISVIIPMGLGFLYFLSRHSVLQFAKLSWQWRDIGRMLFNGSSEMIVQLSTGITTWVFNRVLLSRMGVDGVAAYTIVGYMAFVQIMIVTGFATGVGPIVGYSFGAGKKDHIQRIMKIAHISAFISGVICWAVVLLFPAAIAALFSPGNDTIGNLAESGFALFCTAFLLNGFNILITAYYTSIGNAGRSLVISSLRGLLLINVLVIVLPQFMGDAGIWASYPLAELITLLLAMGLMRLRDNTAISVRKVSERSVTHKPS